MVSFGIQGQGQALSLYSKDKAEDTIHYTVLLTYTRNTFCGTWYLPQNQVHND